MFEKELCELMKQTFISDFFEIFYRVLYVLILLY